jgi:hypothetical protein
MRICIDTADELCYKKRRAARPLAKKGRKSSRLSSSHRRSHHRQRKGTAVAERMLATTGVLKGLKIPESCRGQFVLIVGGKVIAGSKDAGEIAAQARAYKGNALVLDIPASDKAIAAY